MTGWLSDYFASVQTEGTADAAAAGLRMALSLIATLYLWGAVHYLLAARHLAADLDRAE